MARQFIKLDQGLTIQKESRAWPAILSLGYRGAQWMSGSYEAYAREGYCWNSTVYSCINATVRALRGVNFVVYKTSGSGFRAVPKGPLVDLIRRPNPRQSWSSVVGEWAGSLELSGNSYIEGVSLSGKDSNFTQPPKELYILRPDRMYVVPGDSNVPIAGYEYRAGGVTVPYPVQIWRNPKTGGLEPRLPVAHSKYWNPLIEDGDWYGLSPIKAASRYIDAFNSAVQWNVALTQNTARPSGIFSTEDTTLNAAQAEEYTNLIRQKFSGAGNAGRPMVLGKGLSWQQIGLSPLDMAWLEGLEWNSLQICSIYGIPPEIIGDSTHRTYSNFSEARRSVWMEKWLPLLDMLCDDLNTWLTPVFSEVMGDEISIGYDRDAIEAIQEDRQVKWRNARDGADFLRKNEQRALLGYEPMSAEEGGEEVMVTAGTVPLRVAAAQTEMPGVAAAAAAPGAPPRKPSGSTSSQPSNPRIPNKPKPTASVKPRPGSKPGSRTGKPNKPGKKQEDIIEGEFEDVVDDGIDEVLAKVAATRERLKLLMP